MRFYTIQLTADDTPATLKALIEASLASDADELSLFQRKYQNIALITIYPESSNEDHATNGPARIGKGVGLTKVDRIAADAGATDDALQNGFPLLPGIFRGDLFPPVNGRGVYSTETIYITGKTNDVFQIGIVTV